ncbi:MAG TPA: hypothetical protein V6D19_08215 [Stenomitos sp.]
MNQQENNVENPWHSYWHYRPKENFPPKAIRFKSEYQGESRLSLSITQTDLPSKKQRDLVREWCDILPTLSTIRTLWFHSKVTQELFEAVCRMPKLEGLYIKWSCINDLAPISALSNLTRLHIGGAPSAASIEALCNLKNLVDLELENVTAAKNLSFLEQLPQLKSLELSGDSNSLKSLRIETLRPVSKLAELEKLSIFTATVDDESLEPIGELPKLKYLFLSNQFKMEEYAKLAGKLHSVTCDRFSPIDAPVSWTQCKKCGQSTMILLTGKRMPFLCQECDSARIQRHIEKFQEAMQTSAKAK